MLQTATKAGPQLAGYAEYRSAKFPWSLALKKRSQSSKCAPMKAERKRRIENAGRGGHSTAAGKRTHDSRHEDSGANNKKQKVRNYWKPNRFYKVRSPYLQRRQKCNNKKCCSVYTLYCALPGAAAAFYNHDWWADEAVQKYLAQSAPRACW
jgi:hypothetical protein